MLDDLQRATDATVTPRGGFYTLAVLHQLPLAAAAAVAAASTLDSSNSCRCSHCLSRFQCNVFCLQHPPTSHSPYSATPSTLPLCHIRAAGINNVCHLHPQWLLQLQLQFAVAVAADAVIASLLIIASLTLAYKQHEWKAADTNSDICELLLTRRLFYFYKFRYILIPCLQFEIGLVH